MDVYIEYLVKQKKSAQTTVLKVLIVIAVIIFTFIMLSLSLQYSGVSFIFLCLIAGAIFGTWFLFTSLKLEFEYIVTNGEMDVDKIIGQRKRKRLTTIRFKDMEVMAPTNGNHKNEFENKAVKKTVDASSSLNDKGTYFIISRTEKYGTVRLIFNPDERIIKNAQAVAPRKVFTD
jgi:hypothetical protein